MTVIHYRKVPTMPGFNKTVQSKAPAFASYNRVKEQKSVPANIVELENSYSIELLVPGFEKEDFKISLDRTILTVEGSRAKSQEQVNFVLHEYDLRPFSRSFTISENIDPERISANYVNGVLSLNLGKKDAVLKTKKEITIS